MSSLNITTLRNQNGFDSLRELNKASEILKKIYYEKEQDFVGYNFQGIGSYLEQPDNRWISEIWNEKNLYFFNILDENRDEIVFGTYTQILHELKSDKAKPQGKLILTAFKVKEPKVSPVLTVTGKTTDSEKIEKLETDISEIKELLKKMVV